MNQPTKPTDEPKPSQEQDGQTLADVIVNGDVFQQPGDTLMQIR